MQVQFEKKAAIWFRRKEVKRDSLLIAGWARFGRRPGVIHAGAWLGSGVMFRLRIMAGRGSRPSGCGTTPALIVATDKVYGEGRAAILGCV